MSDKYYQLAKTVFKANLKSNQKYVDSLLDLHCFTNSMQRQLHSIMSVNHAFNPRTIDELIAGTELKIRSYKLEGARVSLMKLANLICFSNMKIPAGEYDRLIKPILDSLRSYQHKDEIKI